MTTPKSPVLLPCPQCGHVNQYLTSRQVALRLDVGQAWVGRISGQMGGVKIPGGGYLFPLGKVEEFERERRRRNS